MGKTKKTSKRAHKLLIVDDHPIVRHGLRKLLSHDPNLSVCGEAGTTRETMLIIEREQPDMVVLDISIGRENGLDLVQNIKALSPSTRILVLSMHDEKLYAERAIRAGAHGYLMKHEATDKLMQAVRKIAEGDIYLSDTLSLLLFGGKRFSGNSEKGNFSYREKDILESTGRGMSSKSIAAARGISPKTVEAHKANIKAKLGFKTAGELTQYAVEWRKIHFS